MKVSPAFSLQPSVRPIQRWRWLRAYVARAAASLDYLPAYFYTRFNQHILDAACSALSVYAAFQLRFEGAVPIELRSSMWAWMIGFAAIRPLAMRLTNAHRTIWRYFGLRDCPPFFLSSAVPTLILLALRFGFARPLIRVPGSVLVVEFGIFAFLALGMRALRRLSSEAARESISRPRTLIIGSADTLATAVRQVIAAAQVQVVGLLTPERELHGSCIVGMAVLGSPADLISHISSSRAELILISDATLPNVGWVIEQASSLAIDVRLLPSAQNILRGEALASKPLNLEEILARRWAAIVNSQNHVPSAFGGRSVLITGAGGSIGSELARQVNLLDVKRLVLLDQDENALFEIRRQLEEADCSREIVSIIGDIRDRNHLELIFSQTAPDIVLHAAAYKHVTMMQNNAPEAVLNNVVGTRHVLDVALAAGVERFVMISTDKAVHPSCIMGASKRVAELLVQSRASSLDPSVTTQCACVRFGNVLGSRGSVVPIFTSQIRQGGPVTITDEEMTRYFMTIPEAVHLVLLGATLPARGDVFMLDMGDPVKIVELARKVIEASGLRPGRDIEVKVIGRRAGEKLHEQLCFDGSVVLPTEMEHIFCVQAQPVPAQFEAALVELEAFALERDADTVASCLMRIANSTTLNVAADVVRGD